MADTRIIVFSIACDQSVWYLLVAFVFFAQVGIASETIPDVPVRVEVFTTTDRQVVESVIGSKEPRENLRVTVYELNGIQLIETQLSKGLTGQSDQSKRLTLQRIQMLDDQTRTRMQRSAVGLTWAMQYGIDRFPAIVFDGKVIVYGVIDLNAALVHYHTWRAGAKL